MEQTFIKVKNCKDCPFAQTDWQDSSSFCACPSNKEDEVYYLNYGENEPAPENCPLRDFVLSIELLPS